MFVTRRRIQLLVCLLFITIAAHADWTPVVRHFTPNDYGAGTQNWGIIEQENGWIYAANNYGLLEFDGSRWQLYGISNSTAVRSVARGKGGYIYVGGMAGLPTAVSPTAFPHVIGSLARCGRYT